VLPKSPAKAGLFSYVQIEIVKNGIRTVTKMQHLAEQSFTGTARVTKDSRANPLTVLLHSAALAVRDTKQGSE
jgi:hypothetical protein